MSTERHANTTLFRPDALRHAGLPEHGAVLLARAVPSWALAALVIATAGAIAGVLAVLGTVWATHAPPGRVVAGSRPCADIVSEDGHRLNRPTIARRSAALSP